MLKSKNSYSLIDNNQTKQLKKMMKVNKITISKGLLKKRKKHILAKTAVVLLTCAAIYICYNVITAYLNNQNPGIQNNFSNDQIFEDNNNNEIIFDENGNIIEDPIKNEDKEILLNEINNKLLYALTNRAPETIEKIDNIISISQIPYNMCEDDNQYDKYVITILFEANNKLYNLNYISGEDFKLTQNNEKSYFGEFLSYLSNCSLDMCLQMTENEKNFINSIDNNIFYVMPYYYGYDEESNLIYCIPIFYNDNGKIYSNTYCISTNYIDAYNLDPLTALKEQLNGTKNYGFQVKNFEKNDDFDMITNFYHQLKNEINSDNEINNEK